MSIETVAAAAAEHRELAPGYALHRDYYKGLHYYDYMSERFRKSHEWTLRQARENLMPAVVSAFVDRLSIESWGTEQAMDEAAEQGLQMLANLVHTEAMVTGDAYAITWYRRGTRDRDATFHRADMCVPQVDGDDPSVLSSLVKFWMGSDKRGRANVYTRDGVLRYATQSTITHARRTDRTLPLLFPEDVRAWQAYDAEGAPAEEGHDFGVVPGVWWRFRPDSQFDHGNSVLRDAIPPQDRLNKFIADMVQASERIALPVRYVMDAAPEMLQPKLNPLTGKLEPPKLPFDEAINSIMALTAKGPAGQFPGPDADKLQALKNDAEAEIARVVGVPSYYFSQTAGDVPSGESLRMLNSRLTSGVSTFQQDSSPAWKGQLELLGFPTASITWADPVPVSDEERLANATMERDLGMPPEVWLRTAGYDPSEVDEASVTLADRVRSQARSTGAALGAAFREGAGSAAY